MALREITLAEVVQQGRSSPTAAGRAQSPTREEEVKADGVAQGVLKDCKTYFLKSICKFRDCKFKHEKVFQPYLTILRFTNVYLKHNGQDTCESYFKGVHCHETDFGDCWDAHKGATWVDIFYDPEIQAKPYKEIVEFSDLLDSLDKEESEKLATEIKAQLALK